MPFSRTERKFVYLSMEWCICNISFLLKRENWSIQSPTFVLKGPEYTEWVMVLKPHPDLNYNYLFILRRLPSDAETEPGTVWVDFKLSVSTGFNNAEYYNPVLYCFDDTTEYEMPVRDDGYHLQKSMEFKNDFLTIQCDMIVYPNDDSSQFEPCSIAGVKVLSDDLLELFNTGEYHDVELMFKNDYLIQVHKAILHAQYPTIFRLCPQERWIIRMEESKEIATINVEGKIGGSGMMNILRYVYSGDIRHVFEKPSVDISKLLNYLQMKELGNAYYMDRLLLRSEIDVQELQFNWIIIRDFNRQYENNNTISSPVLSEAKYHTKWQLHFYTKSPSDANYVALFAEILDEIIFVDACLECAVVDDKGVHHICDIVLCGRYEGRKKLGFSELAKRESVKRYAPKGILRLKLRLRLSDGTRIYFVDKDTKSFFFRAGNFKTYPDEDSFFSLLSTNLSNLLNSAAFSDGVIQCGKLELPIHKCILAARSSVLKKMISHTTDISGMIEPRIFIEFLRYIYSGTLDNDLTIEDLKDFRAAAVTFKLPYLRYFCDSQIDGKI